ncbi:hypothetical protein DPMN_044773, partial [Dreissena polymorpha]
RATPVPTSESDSEAGSSPVPRHGRAQNLNFNNVGVDRGYNWRTSEQPYSGEEPWEKEPCFIPSIQSSRKGEARRDYCTLVKRMKQRFGSSVHESKYLGMLENRQRRPEESIISLCDDIRQLTKKAYNTNGIDRKLSGLIKGLDTRLERLESVSLARSTQQSPKTKSESRKCFKCRSEAHLFRDCPQSERQSFGEVSRNVPAHLSQGNGSRSTQ